MKCSTPPAHKLIKMDVFTSFGGGSSQKSDYNAFLIKTNVVLSRNSHVASRPKVKCVMCEMGISEISPKFVLFEYPRNISFENISVPLIFLRKVRVRNMHFFICRAGNEKYVGDHPAQRIFDTK